MQRKLETKKELDKIQEMIYQNKTFKEMSDYFGGIAPMTIKSAAKRNNLDLSNYKPKRKSPKRRKTLSEEDIAMISESLNNGCFKIDVANKLNISVPTLESLIDYYGIDISNFRRRSFGNTKVLSKDQQVELQQMLDSGVSYKKIGEHFGSSRNIIKVWINRYDLHTDRGKNTKPKIEDRDFIFIKNMIQQKIPVNNIAACIGKSESSVVEEIKKRGIRYTDIDSEKPTDDILALDLNAYYESKVIAGAKHRVSITIPELNYFKTNISKKPFCVLCNDIEKSYDFMLRVIKVFNLTKLFLFTSFQKYKYFQELEKDLLNPFKYCSYLSYKYGVSRQTIVDWKSMYGTEKDRVNIFYSKTSAEIHMEEILDSIGLCYVYQYKVKNYRCDYYIGQHIVIDVQGDYWHEKDTIENRDTRKKTFLEKCGYTILQIWEHSINNNPNDVAKEISKVYIDAIKENFQTI